MVGGYEAIMREPLISVIVPIYNVEKYLKQCVDSIINQTYHNLEIILVDDGSPDNCGAICDEYAKTDNRIRVIHKPNGGLSDARNAGIKTMHGEYLMFVDSDDYITEDCIAYLYDISVRFSADLVIGGFEKFENETKCLIYTTAATNECVEKLNNREAMKNTLINGCAAWARLYKADVHHNIMFPVGEINEDEAIVLSLLEKCQIVVNTNKVIYKYRYRSQSITSTRWDRNKLDWCNHCKANLEFISEKYPDLIIYAKQRYCSSVIWALNNMTSDKNRFSDLIPKYQMELKKCIGDKNCFKEISFKEKLRAYLLAYLFNLYATFVRMIGKHYT